MTITRLDRKHNGTFATGNKGGPGRPPRAIERDYLLTLSECCPPDIWREIVQRAVEDAKQGDGKARDWLAAYLVGNPKTPAVSLVLAAVHEARRVDPVGDAITDADRMDALLRGL